MDDRNSDAGIVAVKLAEFFGVLSFIQVIHLLENPMTEFIDQRDEITADQTDIAVQPSRDVAHDVEIKRDLLTKTRTLHLDGHALTVVEHTAVHLAEGGGGDRIAFEFGVDAVHRSTEILFNAGHGQIAVEARQLVL